MPLPSAPRLPGGCRARPRARALGAALALVLALAGAVAPGAARAEGHGPAEALLAEGRALFLQGATGAARAKYSEAIALTAEAGPAAAMAPYAAYAESFLVDGNLAKANEFATFVLDELADPVHASEPALLRALAVRGVALWLEGRAQEAEAMLSEVDARLASHPPHVVRSFLRPLAVLARVRMDAGTGGLDLAAAIRAAWAPDGELTAEEFGALLYAEMLALRQPRDEAGRAAARTEGAAIVERAGEVDGLPPETLTNIQQQYASMLLDQGERAEARLWAERVDAALTAREDFGHQYLLNGEVLTFLDYFDGRPDDALARAARLRDLALGAVPPRTELGAVLERDIGLIHEATGRTDLAQASFRSAYATVRRVRRLYDPEVESYRARIDPADPGMASFPLAAEFGATISPPDYLPNGADVLRLYLAGNFQSLGETLPAAGERPLEMLNIALFHAVGGNHDAMVATLDAARKAARTTLGSAVPANSPWFDLVEVLGTVWGTAHALPRAEDPLARLAARAGRLDAEARAVYLALAAFHALQTDRIDAMVRFTNAWLGEVDWGAEMSVWELFAATMIVETGFRGLPDTAARRLHQRVRTRLEARPELILALDYVDLSLYAKGLNQAATAEGLLRLGAITKRLQASAPKPISFRAAGRIGYADALWLREDYAGAFAEYEAAVGEYRLDPYHRADVLASLMSSQATLLAWMGEYDRQRVMARQSYELAFSAPALTPAYLVGPVQAYALSFWYAGDNARAIAILQRHMADPAFTGEMDTPSLLRMGGLLAQLLDADGRPGEALAALDALEPLAEREREVAPLDYIAYLQNRATVERQLGALGRAFEMVHRANALGFALRRTLAAGTFTGEVVRTSGELDRVGQEAAIGWDYAQGLPE